MDQQQSFMDSKTITAIILVGLVWFGWQSYMTTKYPKPPSTKEEANRVVPGEKAVPEKPVPTATIKVDEPKTEKLLTFDDDVWTFAISSQGMGLKNLTLKRYTDRKNAQIQIGADQAPHLPMSTHLNDTLLNFQISQAAPREFVGVAEKDGVRVTKTLKIESANFLIYSTIKIEGNSGPVKVANLLAEDSLEGAAKEAAGKQMGGEPTLWQSFFVSYSGSNDHNATTVESPHKETYEKVSVAALTGKYFGQAIVDDSPTMPTFRTDFDSTYQRYLGWLTYDLSSPTELKLKFFGGPKSMNLLRTADPRLEKSIDYGMFGWLASPLLKLMNWLFSITLNYGVAIILMTILVRIAVLPFNLASYKSMKAMQVIQPQVNKLKEKYKDDPQAMNREMMRIMKEHNANPLMGCLPMLLQLPVFFALYQVLDHSIELYKAPFMFWIHDLSLRDPFFVLPILMGITMFIQQKITPTTLDPAQARVMLFMPIIFTALMFTLPSGLTLYIFISTLFGIIQQMVFMRDKNRTTTAIPAKA